MLPVSTHRLTFTFTMLNIGQGYIRTCEMIDGKLPKKQTKLVLAWAELHQEDLMADWELVMNGEEPFKIQPLQ